MSTPITTRDLLARLERHYIKPGQPLPGGIFLPECGWNGGNALAGGCDALYVGFTSTSGRILIGHELKVSRSDWLNELNKPGKSDGWADECHEWWLVVGDPAIVRDGELPAGWGLMSPGKSKTRMQVHQKPDRKGREHQPSWRACRSIMARQDTLRANAINTIRQTAQRDALRDIDKQVEDRLEIRMRAQPDGDRLRSQLQQIEHALGARIDWSDSDRRFGHRHNTITLDDLAAVAALIRTHGHVDDAVRQFTTGYAVPTEAIRNVLKRFNRELDQFDAALAELKAAHPRQPEQLALVDQEVVAHG